MRSLEREDFYLSIVREDFAMSTTTTSDGFPPTDKAYALLQEFKAFALKGNVVDLAVGVIIGAAFGRLVDSLVKNIIMPTVGLLLPVGQGYVNWKWEVGDKVVPFGLFLGEIVNFLIVSLALFFFVRKFLGFLLSMRQEEKNAIPPLTKDQQLLTEIRDLLTRQADTASDRPPS
jgi:large conductance mechanosensitive channel